MIAAIGQRARKFIFRGNFSSTALATGVGGLPNDVYYVIYLDGFKIFIDQKTWRTLNAGFERSFSDNEFALRL